METDSPLRTTKKSVKRGGVKFTFLKIQRLPPSQNEANKKKEGKLPPTIRGFRIRQIRSRQIRLILLMD